ncbi:MAG: prolyl oligopeptidase family serine peptidase [Chlamydiales bacterium]|nr:prolyl oligopeptidase family serine peptidase [Chlamydiales bacterium]
MVQSLTLENGLSLSYLGKDLGEGPLPALFYFALSGEESLMLDPYNQPAAFLANYPMRLFSMSLPFHGPGFSPVEALTFWAKRLAEGHNLIEEFVDQVKAAFEHLVNRGAILHDHVGVAGLSRGAFIACHVAAKIPQIDTILGFAPLVDLSSTKEFEEIAELPLIKSLRLESQVDALIGRSLRFYIGNLDTRVGTSRCFQFIEMLSKKSQERGVRSPRVELRINPSIGHQGHGTSKEIFEHGAAWMARKLGASLQ